MKVEKSIIIDCPQEKVFAFVTDMSNVTSWTPAIEIRPLGDDVMGVGARFVQVVVLMGKRIEATTEVTAYDPPREFAFKTVAGPIPLRNAMTFSKLDNKTRVDIVGEGEPGNMFKLAGPLFNNTVKKQIEAQLEQLKQILERDAQ